MIDEATLERARAFAAGLRPNSPWAKMVLRGQRDQDDEVRVAVVILETVAAKLGPMGFRSYLEGLA